MIEARTVKETWWTAVIPLSSITHATETLEFTLSSRLSDETNPAYAKLSADTPKVMVSIETGREDSAYSAALHLAVELGASTDEFSQGGMGLGLALLAAVVGARLLRGSRALHAMLPCFEALGHALGQRTVGAVSALDALGAGLAATALFGQLLRLADPTRLGERAHDQQARPRP